MISKLFARVAKEAQTEDGEKDKDQKEVIPEPTMPTTDNASDAPIPEEGSLQPADAAPAEASATAPEAPEVELSGIEQTAQVEQQEAAADPAPDADPENPADDTSPVVLPDPTATEAPAEAPPAPDAVAPAPDATPAPEVPAEPVEPQTPAEPAEPAQPETPPEPEAQPETAPAESAPAEQAPPAVEPDLGEPVEGDEAIQGADAADTALTESDDVGDVNVLDQTSQELQRVVVTLESFAEMIEGGEVDDQSRAVIDQTLGSIEQDFGFDAAPVPATESVDGWTNQTKARIAAMESALGRGLTKANEGLWDKVRALFGSMDGKLSVMTDKLAAARTALLQNPDRVIEFDGATAPYIVYSGATSSAAMKDGIVMATTPVHFLCSFISKVVHKEIAGDEDWSKTLSKHFKLTPVDKNGSFATDLAYGMGPQQIIGFFFRYPAGSFRGLNKDSYSYVQEIKDRAPRRKVAMTITAKDLATRIGEAEKAAREARQAVAWLNRTTSKLEDNHVFSSAFHDRIMFGSMARLAKTAASQLLPLQLNTYRELIRLAS